MNKKVIEDLIKNNPDLDKKKLEEVIVLLKQNNPDIKIDKKFKQNLKYRLDAIIDFKQETKKGFFGRLFLIPIFSVFLIAGGIFYIYGNINSLNNNDLQYTNSEILDEMRNIEEIEEEISSENQNSPIIPFHKGDEDKNKIIKKEIKRKNVEKNIKQKIEIKKEETQIEDNQIIEILGEGTKENNEVSDDNFEAEVPANAGSSKANTMFYDNGSNEPYINSFVDYCEEYSSEILVDNDGINYCIIEEKICMESDYSENTCKLIEKK